MWGLFSNRWCEGIGIFFHCPGTLSQRLSLPHVWQGGHFPPFEASPNSMFKTSEGTLDRLKEALWTLANAVSLVRPLRMGTACSCPTTRRGSRTFACCTSAPLLSRLRSNTRRVVVHRVQCFAKFEKIETEVTLERSCFSVLDRGVAPCIRFDSTQSALRTDLAATALPAARARTWLCYVRLQHGFSNIAGQSFAGQSDRYAPPSPVGTITTRPPLDNSPCPSAFY